MAAELSGQEYSGLIAPEYKWEAWAVPKDVFGKLDHHLALTGDDLRDFVDHKPKNSSRKWDTLAGAGQIALAVNEDASTNGRPAGAKLCAMNISRLQFRLRIYSLLALPALFVMPVLARATAHSEPTVATKSNHKSSNYKSRTEVFTAQILATEKSRYAAMVKADVKALSPFLSDDLTYVRSTGVVQTKIGLLDEVKSGKMRYRKIESQKPMIRFYGETAIVNGLAYFELVRYGKEEDVLAVFTAVYVLNGKGTGLHWQLAAWQSNLTPTKKHLAAIGNYKENTDKNTGAFSH